jgi:hypothetical protein
MSCRPVGVVLAGYVFGQYNKATDGSSSVEAEYLEVVATPA